MNIYQTIHTSCQRKCSSGPNSDLSKSVADFRENGVAILPVRINPEFIQESKDIVMKSWQDALNRAKNIRGHDMKVGMEFGFEEFVQRAPGRYDLHWGVNGDSHFLDHENVLSQILPFVHEVLGGQTMTKLDFNGCLFSVPGAKEQLWHVDGEHLFSSETGPHYNGESKESFFSPKNLSSILPTHCLNVFIPLVDVERNNGGTEFCLGSHFLTKFFSDEIVWQDSRWKDRIEFNGEILTVKVNAGEVLAFDYRVLHRALEHGGDHARPLLYYTYTKRWFTDAMNFANLPSLKEADQQVPESEVLYWRSQFPSISETKENVTILCDGAAGTQVAKPVIDKMVEHMKMVGNTNVGGTYRNSESVLDLVTKARQSGRLLLSSDSQGTAGITFGLNCTNLIFHLARSMGNCHQMFQSGDNVVLSRACHDANVAPWLRLAKTRNLEVRWLETLGDKREAEDDINIDKTNIDQINTDMISDLIDDKTRVVSLGLASNATGRIHIDVLDKIHEAISNLSVKPYLVVDGTHFIPHRRFNLHQFGVDVVICSVYKFFGPHIGIMAYNKERFMNLKPTKVGLRYDGEEVEDILDYGLEPSEDNCQISRWEMGTLNYEGLAGFEGCIEYISSIASSHGTPEDKLDESMRKIKIHEENISRRFIQGITDLLDNGKMILYGTRNPSSRTPTFAVVLNTETGIRDPYHLVNILNKEGINCTHGNHYAPYLVEESMSRKEGVTRISFMHYNTLEEVDRVVKVLKNTCK